MHHSEAFCSLGRSAATNPAKVPYWICPIQSEPGKMNSFSLQVAQTIYVYNFLTVRSTAMSTD